MSTGSQTGWIHGKARTTSTLEMRRLRQDMVFTYRVIPDLVSDACNELFATFNFIIPARGHSFKLYINAVGIYLYC